jgi:hypothetical protein
MQANGLARADAPISEERKQQIATFLGDLPEEYNERESRCNSSQLALLP